MLTLADSTVQSIGAQLLAILSAIWGVAAAAWHAVLGVVLAEPGGWLKGALLVAALAYIEWRMRYSLGGWVNTIKRPSEHGSGAWVILTAPGVACHELGHALMTLLFYPLGYRVRRIVLFSPGLSRVAVADGRSMAAVGYVATSDPPRPIPMVHDVARVLISLAPLPFGLLVMGLLYSWLTGHAPWQPGGLHLGGHPWWADALLIYLLLCVIANCWPSRGDFINTKPHLLGLGITVLVLALVIFLLRATLAAPWASVTANAAQFEGNIAAAILLMTVIEFGLLLLVSRGQGV
ncbi:MAG TPA: hypothetical protein VKT82_07340 [Ktedonobacterales bacterium]|nr:hypothetical protein [Ktedonobacterales bacterium]